MVCRTFWEGRKWRGNNLHRRCYWVGQPKLWCSLVDHEIRAHSIPRVSWDCSRKSRALWSNVKVGKKAQYKFESTILGRRMGHYSYPATNRFEMLIKKPVWWMEWGEIKGRTRRLCLVWLVRVRYGVSNELIMNITETYVSLPATLLSQHKIYIILDRLFHTCTTEY